MSNNSNNDFGTSLKNSNHLFPGVIAICGAAGRLGNLLVRRLHRTDKVISIDPRDFKQRPKDVKHYKTEIRNRKCLNVFRQRKIKAVIYLGPHFIGDQSKERSFSLSIENFNKLLQYCDKYDVKKIILLSSSAVYGARAKNPQFLTEEAPLLAADLSALRDVDMMAQSFFWKRPDIETVILRPAHITGAVHSVFAKYLRLSPVPLLLGFDPMIQLVHEQDVIQSILLSLENNKRGIFNIAGPSPVPLSRIIKKLKRKTKHIPHFIARPVIENFMRLGMSDMHPAYIDYIRYICMVDDSRARKIIGYNHLKNLDKTIKAIDAWQ